MAIYRYIADSDRYDCIRVAPQHRLIFEAFCDAKPLADSWRPIPICVDSGPRGRGDFPSLYCHVPVFSRCAWDLLRPLIGNAVEALPLIYPDDREYFVVNVLDLVDCLDRARSEIAHYSDGGISHVRSYAFAPDRLSGRILFKIPETPELEVLVSDRFTHTVESEQLKGLLFAPLDK